MFIKKYELNLCFILKLILKINIIVPKKPENIEVQTVKLASTFSTLIQWEIDANETLPLKCLKIELNNNKTNELDNKIICIQINFFLN